MLINYSPGIIINAFIHISPLTKRAVSDTTFCEIVISRTTNALPINCAQCCSGMCFKDFYLI